MQTFLPYKSFEFSARVLDRARLGKQRVETLQIMTALLTGKGWIHHPATKMWAGYTNWLLEYQKAMCDEWERRGYTDNCMAKTLALYHEHRTDADVNRKPPPWLGLKKLHSSHRANLLRKSYTWYYKFHWPEKPAEGYWWPTKEMKVYTNG